MPCFTGRSRLARPQVVLVKIPSKLVPASMSKPLQVSNPSTPLHLYRHLLRESSYLPPYARPYFDGRIKTRFRNHAHSIDIKTPLKQGHHGLRHLRAAILGDRDRMRRLVLMAFGRVGYRRRMLVSQMVQPLAPTGTASLEEYMEKATANLGVGRKQDWLDQWNLDKFTVFARSQARRTFNDSPLADLVQKQLDMSQWSTGTSIWGRPTDPTLARSRLRKAWMMVASRILPPIPKAEWELLRDLALGKAPASVWELPPRRPLTPRLTADDLDSDAWNWEAYASRPIASVEVQKGRRNKLLNGELGTDSPVDPPPIGRHNYTPKSWRRLLHSIWALTATMEKSSTGDGWDIVWGGEDFKPPTATDDHSEFFQDVPDTPQNTKKTKRR